MTSYITITDAETDPEAPLTSELAKKWRDNPIAIAEKDTTVPLTLRLGKWLLGTVTTTSGSTQTLSSLDLTNLTSLECIVNGVSTNSSTSQLRLAGQTISQTLGSVSGTFYGTITVDLATGIISSKLSTLSETAGSVYNATSSLTTSSTSLSFTLAGGSFDAGSIRVYGVK